LACVFLSPSFSIPFPTPARTPELPDTHPLPLTLSPPALVQVIEFREAFSIFDIDQEGTSLELPELQAGCTRLALTPTEASQLEAACLEGLSPEEAERVRRGEVPAVSFTEFPYSTPLLPYMDV